MAAGADAARGGYIARGGERGGRRCRPTAPARCRQRPAWLTPLHCCPAPAFPGMLPTCSTHTQVSHLLWEAAKFSSMCKVCSGHDLVAMHLLYQVSDQERRALQQLGRLLAARSSSADGNSTSDAKSDMQQPRPGNGWVRAQDAASARPPGWPAGTMQQ